jgi:cell division septation protein DedD
MAADDKRGPGIWDAEPRRSVFAALWFRVVLVLIVVGAVGVLAVPRVLDLMNPPPPQRPLATKPAPPMAPLPLPAPGPADTPSADPAPPASVPPASAPAVSGPATPAAPATLEKTPAERPKATTAKRTARRPAKAAATTSESGAYWLQVGAFKDPDAAKRLAARLRAQNYHVTESSTGPAGNAPGASAPGGGAASDRYDVFVVGNSPADVTAKLSAKGLATEPGRDGGVVVKPSLPLRDAVALSKDLAAEGLKVQVRRSSSQASAAAAPAPAPSASGDGLHRVQVGPYASRAAAAETLKELEGKGYKPFIARR